MVGKVAASNFPVKLALAASIVLAATAVLAAGIYYYNGYNSGPAGVPRRPPALRPQARQTLPRRQSRLVRGKTRPSPSDAPSLDDVPIVAHVDAPPPLTLVDAHEGPEFTPTRAPSPPLIPSLPKDTPGPAAVKQRLLRPRQRQPCRSLKPGRMPRL